MSEHPNLARMREGYEAIAGGDLANVLDLFADDGVMHVGGHGPLSGDHTGRAAIGDAFAGLFEWTGGTVKLEVSQLFADDHNAVALVRETAQRASDGLTLDVSEVHLFRMVNGVAVEFWDVPADQDREAHDAFFAL
jgi:ketosteroid isomerase-like protein